MKMRLALALLFLPACSAATTAQWSAITNGQDDDGDPSVVALVEGGAMRCTGTVIAPRVVVTAGHCVAGLAPSSLSVFFGSQIVDGGGAGGGELDVTDIKVHPQFDEGTLRDDIALLLLARDAPMPPLPVLHVSMDDAVGATIRLIGFGFPSASAGDLSRKRQGTSTVASVAATTFTFGASPSQTCFGDSGGPAFLTVDGTEWLAGVTSFGDSDCSSYGVDTRADIFAADFIEPAVRAADTGSWSSSAGGCSAVPSRDALPTGEATICLLVLLGGCARRGDTRIRNVYKNLRFRFRSSE